jgi:Tol biopolymer transport system component
MNCQNCGAENKDQAKFCVICGKPLQPAAEPLSAEHFIPPPPPEAAPVLPAAAEPTVPGTIQPKSRRLPWPLLALGGIALLAVCLVAVLGGVALLHGRGSNRLAYLVTDDRDEDLGLYVVDPKDGTSLLFIPADDEDPFGAFEWSPNGRYIAYSVYESYNRVSLWIVDVRSGETNRLVRNASFISFFGDVPFSWSPDNRRLAYSPAEDQIEDLEVFVIESDGSHNTSIASGFMPIWSPNGNYIAFSRYDNDGEYSSVYLIRPDGSRETLLAEHRRTSYGAYGWSPDSRWVVTLMNEDDGITDIVQVSRDGKEQINLTDSDDESDTCPRFSPNGRWVAYLTCERYDSTACELNLVRPDGSDRHRLASDTMLPYFTWSPDSRSIIYSTSDGEVVTVDIDTGRDTTLIQEIEGLARPIFAP